MGGWRQGQTGHRGVGRGQGWINEGVW
jgi:hypothetical protein